MKIFFYGFVCILSTNMFAQKQAEVSLELHDGNIIKGTTSIADIELLTAYGKLNIPVSKVFHIEIGTGKDNSVSEKARQPLKLLSGSSDEETRKGAYADLVKLGPKAIPAINEFMNDPKNFSEESSATSEYTIDNALSEIRGASNIDMDAPTEDILSIEDNYVMGGSYNFSKMEVKTQYGNLTVPKEKIKSMDLSVAIEPGKGEISLKLNASKHISGNTNGGWLKTGIILKAGQRFSIDASGEVTLASLSNSQYKPDGSSKAVGAADYVKPYTAAEGDIYSAAYPTYGQLVYRIGENGSENLKAGAKFSGTAKTSGMLMLSIYETVYNAGNKGAYSVKISLGK